MAGKIRVGIVGATVTVGGSGWGARTHVPALHALPDYELKAVCTTREETALASQKAFNTDLAFHSFDTMLASPEVDLVSVVFAVEDKYGVTIGENDLEKSATLGQMLALIEAKIADKAATQ